jgi:hypothetical protein
VRFKHGHRNAHATFVAVSESFHTTNATKATLNAMKGLFRLQHVK